MLLETGPNGLHVIIYAESKLRGPVITPETWQRYQALYGAGYNWEPATREKENKFRVEEKRLSNWRTQK